MKGDSLKTALDLVREEIFAVREQLIHEGAEAFKRGRFEDAKRLATQGTQLEKFTEKLSALREEWTSNVEPETRERVKVSPELHSPTQPKGPKKNLRIIFPDGHVVQRPSAAAAVVDVIEQLGVEQVLALDLRVSGVPLVGTKQHPKYGQSPLGDWLVCTHSNTAAKKDLLEKIGKALKTDLKVELIPS